ncbi:immunoglobulin kappa light chain-like [Lissotriton helveticus]
MEGARCTLVLLVLFTGMEARESPTLMQPLPSITTGGRHPKITCSLSGSSVTDHVLSWYKQPDHQGLSFLVSHRERAKPSYGEGVSERFLPGIEKESRIFTLTIGNTERSDEGTYYCAIWYSNQYIFGDGTRVIYKDTSDLKKPTVRLLGPAPREVRGQDQATFVCAVDGFYPDVIRIKWLVDGIQDSDTSQEFPSLAKKDGTYKAVGRLTVEAKAWERGAEVVCLVEHESGTQTLSRKGEVVTRRAERGCTRGAAEQLGLFGNETSGNSTASVDLYGVLGEAFYVYLSALFLSSVYGLTVAFCFLKRRLEDLKKSSASTSHRRPSQRVDGRWVVQRRK